MEKYIKVENKRIVSIQPLLKATIPVDPTVPPEQMEYKVDEELQKKIDQEYIKVNTPEGIEDIVLMDKYYYENGKFIKTDNIINKRNLSEEYYEITSWLKENDWKFNKVFIGEWEDTDPRWVEYKEQRAIKRARLDEIKVLLG